MVSNRRTGRRPGDARTREQIVVAARESFAANGYDGTTMRGVAAAAGVDAALLHYFFGTKDGLFAAVMEMPVSPAKVADDVLSGGVDGMGDRLARRFLQLWDDPESGPALVGLIRGATSHQPSAELIRDFVGREILGRIAATLDRPDAALRAELCGAQVMGTAFLRYVLRAEPLASAPAEEVAAWLGPTLQRYLTGEPPDRPVG